MCPYCRPPISQRIQQTNGVGRVEMPFYFFRCHPSRFRYFFALPRGVPVMNRSKNKCDDPAGHVLVHTRQSGVIKTYAGFFEHFTAEPFDDCFVGLQGPPRWFPLVVVSPAYRQDAIAVDDRGRDTYPVFSIRVQGCSTQADLYRRVYERTL